MNRVRIAYLELSERNSGKTTRLHQLACAFAEQGLPVAFVTPSKGSLHHEKISYFSPDRLPSNAAVRSGEHVWFFDEFASYKTLVPIIEGGYYASSTCPAADVKLVMHIEKLILANDGYALSLPEVGTPGRARFITEWFLTCTGPGEYAFAL